MSRAGAGLNVPDETTRSNSQAQDRTWQSRTESTMRAEKLQIFARARDCQVKTSRFRGPAYPAGTSSGCRLAAASPAVLTEQRRTSVLEGPWSVRLDLCRFQGNAHDGC